MKIKDIYATIESTLRVFSLSEHKRVFAGYCTPVEEVPESVLNATIVRIYTYADAIFIDIA